LNYTRPVTISNSVLRVPDNPKSPKRPSHVVAIRSNDVSSNPIAIRFRYVDATVGGIYGPLC